MPDQVGPTSSSRKRTRADSENVEAPDAKRSRDTSTTDADKRTKKKRSKGSRRKKKASVTAAMEHRNSASASPKKIPLGTHSIVLSDDDNTEQEDIEPAYPEAGPSKLPPSPTVKQEPRPLQDQEMLEPKGKSKDPPQSPAKDPVHNDENRVTLLEKLLEEKTALLSKHHAALSQIQSNITCQICLDLMYKPFALAPCGHLACYNCLVAWFKAPPSNDQDFAPPVVSRRKTCPHCRAVIRDRPAEVWDVKNIVLTLSKSSLIDTVEGTLDTANDPIPADPWEGIFRPVPPRGHNIFQALFPHDHEPAPPAPGAGGPTMGMYDAEDGGVYRCLDCMHEIFRGRCTSCNRAYPGHHDYDEDEDEDYEDMPFDTEDELSELEEAMMVGLHHPFFGGIYDEEDDEEEDDEDNEYDLYDSFIDDMDALPSFGGYYSEEEEDASTEEGSETEEGSPPSAFIVELDSDGNEVREEEDHDDAHSEGTNRNGDSGDEDGVPPPRRLATSRRRAIVESDDDDSQEEDISFAPTRLRGRRPVFMDQDESYEDDGSIPGPASRLRSHMISMDEDGDEDEQSEGKHNDEDDEHDEDDEETIEDDDGSAASGDFSEREDEMHSDY